MRRTFPTSTPLLHGASRRLATGLTRGLSDSQPKQSEIDMITYDQLRRNAEHTRSKLKGYQVLDLEAIWESDIVPLIDDRKDLQDAHTACMRGFVRDHGYRDQRVKARTYNEPEHGGSWVFTPSDHWFTTISDRIEAAATAGDSFADQYHHIWSVYCLNDETGVLPKEVEVELREAAERMRLRYEPKRDEPRYWAPVHSCHWSNTWAYCVAKAWRPEGRWKVRTTIDHTTVVDTKAKQVFDVLMYDFPIDEIRKVGNFK